MATAIARPPATGFTLIEVVVALLIVALGMAAVYLQLGQYASNASYLEEKTLASWIATNRLTELSVQTEWPELGSADEEIEFAGRAWVYTVDVSATQVENLRRVDIAVARAERPERLIHEVSALIEPPVPGFVPLRWDGGAAGGGG